MHEIDVADLMREVLNYFEFLTPQERAACDLGLQRGYMAVPEPTTGVHLVCYGALCAAHDRPCVILLPPEHGKRKLLVWPGEPEVLSRVALVAVDAGVTLSRVCPIWVRLVGFIDAERGEPVTQLISKVARELGSSNA